MAGSSVHAMPGQNEDPGADPTFAKSGLGALDDDAFDALGLLSRALHLREARLEDTLHAVLQAATAVMPCARDAGLNLMVGNRFTPQATIGAAPPMLDALQQRTGEGPCIESSRSQVTINIDDMHGDSRWPQFASAAIATDVYSMLCLPLWVNDETLGSLSLYGATPKAFGPTDKRLAELYATHAALALAEARRTDQLRRAMATRDVIGQAKGILMERHRVKADEAFTMLKQHSQRVNRKLVDVAEAVAVSGELPEA